MKVDDISYVSREESFEIENPEVFVATISSDVQILESTDGKCYVQVLAHSEDTKRLAELVEIHTRNQRLTVRVETRGKNFRKFHDGKTNPLLVVIKLPKLSSLKIKTVSADIEIHQALSSIQVGSVSGDITILRNPVGECAVKTVSGDITAITFSACRYSLRSVSGDIKVNVAAGLEVDVDGRSVSGALGSEISLSSSDNASEDHSELVTISTSTVSGDFTLARN
jgi:hypothetical protein